MSWLHSPESEIHLPPPLRRGLVLGSAVARFKQVGANMRWFLKGCQSGGGGVVTCK